MTQFDDGPAKGVALALHRAAKFLRVTFLEGHWDALDQLEDRPQPKETLYAYQIREFSGRVHIYRGKRGSGFYAIANYKFVTTQPTDEQMRNEDQWDAWCKAQPDPYPQ